jgi:hypothetical protein
MTQFLLQWRPTPEGGPCAACGQQTAAPPGTQLVEAGSLQPVCSPCGQRLAPALVALAQLANEAERVGRISRHTVFPPYTALLDLARAADNYTSSVPEVER